jgi:hypothetical protein
MERMPNQPDCNALKASESIRFGNSGIRAVSLNIGGLQTSGFIVQAYNTDNLAWADATNGGKVNFVFDHILSKIAFSAKTAMDYSSTAVVKVTDFQLGFGSTAIQTNGNFAFDGTKATLGSWTLSTTKNYIPTTQQDLYTGSGGELTTGVQEINDNTQYLMVLPQTVAANALTAHITYTITADGQTTTYNIVKSLPTVTLEQGKQYTFNFTFTLNQVVFEGISVGGWTDTQPDNTPL